MSETHLFQPNPPSRTPHLSPFTNNHHRLLPLYRQPPLHRHLAPIDLHIQYNEALHATSNDSLSILPVYLFNPRGYSKSSFGFDKIGPYRATFLLQSVDDLRHSHRARDSDLIIRIGRSETDLGSSPALSTPTPSSWSSSSLDLTTRPDPAISTTGRNSHRHHPQEFSSLLPCHQANQVTDSTLFHLRSKGELMIGHNPAKPLVVFASPFNLTQEISSLVFFTTEQSPPHLR